MSNSSIISGGAPIPAGDTVVADQKTIRGAGTPNSPLRVAGGTGNLPNIGVTPGTIVPGMPIRIGTFGGAHVVASEANAISSAYVLGVATSENTNAGGLDYQSNGVVKLTTTEWDVVAGTSGGLAEGTMYYLSDTTAGNLLPRASIVTSGHFLTQIGMAISATELQLQICAPIAIP